MADIPYIFKLCIYFFMEEYANIQRIFCKAMFMYYDILCIMFFSYFVSCCRALIAASLLILLKLLAACVVEGF